MDLFGLVRVEHPDRPVMPWAPAGVEHVPFGDAVFTLLFAARFLDLRERTAPEDDDRRG